ncbi:MAG: hypothetical protein AAFN77_02635 [Planctomycetota bacterium]
MYVRRLMLVTLVLFSSTCCRSVVAQPTTTVLDEPVKVSRSAEKEIFPKSWRTSRINANADPIDSEEVERTKQILNSAFNKYPKKVLSANLKTVFILRRLRFFGVSASGTNSTDCVYMANRGVEAGFDDAWVEGVFHAEFSSILLRNFRGQFDQEVWQKINKAGFQYGGNGVEAIRNGAASKNFDPALYEQGFLYEYAQSSLENDFNSIAQQLFTGNPEFWKIVKAHSAISQKVDLAIGFYQKIDPTFDREYFESLAKTVGNEKPSKGAEDKSGRNANSVESAGKAK